MVVIQRVKRLPTVATDAHKACGTQQPQLVGHRGLGNLDQRREIPDAAFAVTQGVENPDTRGIRQHPENFGDGLEGRSRQEFVAEFVNGGQVHDLLIYEHVCRCQPAETPPEY